MKLQPHLQGVYLPPYPPPREVTPLISALIEDDYSNATYWKYTDYLGGVSALRLSYGDQLIYQYNRPSKRGLNHCTRPTSKGHMI
jgi:hypothetical protein